MLGNFMELLTKKAPELPEGYTWLNTDEPLSLNKLKGHVVIMDFWTYACINCMHVLPVLSKIEEAYKNKPVIVIGVHSAKFKNEESSANIRQAVERYDITHPVIVDEKKHIWQEYFVSAWPTLVIISPTGKIAYKLAGEYSFSQLSQLVDDTLQNAAKEGTLAKSRIKIIAPPRKKSSRTLSFPGKISFSKDKAKFALSDSNNNRILVIDTKSGKILNSIGDTKAGLEDGKFAKARFSRPQGVLWQDDRIFVADTDNHALREINLKTSKVSTLAGTGKPGLYANYGVNYPAKSTPLNSPWDLASDGKIIFIAMAGFHQIWAYDLKKSSLSVFAGRGSENITDGAGKNAELAQPSGLWLSKDTLYVADSEASAVRSINTKSRYVSTLLGSGLFAFGDQSGSLSSSMLQHPIGICASDETLYIADTFNSTIKSIDLKKKKVGNVIGNKLNKSVCRFDDPDCDSLGLYEPNDVKVAGDILYIVDTNNHLVRTFSIKDKVLKTLKIK